MYNVMYNTRTCVDHTHLLNLLWGEGGHVLQLPLQLLGAVVGSCKPLRALLEVADHVTQRLWL